MTGRYVKEENFDVKDWLESYGFSVYVTAFEENDIGRDELLHLNEDNLKELGVDSLGERKRMMQEISTLKKALSLGKTKRTALLLTGYLLGSWLTSLVVGVTTALQYNFSFYYLRSPSNREEAIRDISLDVGFIIATGIIVSLGIGLIIFRRLSGKFPLEKAMKKAIIGSSILGLAAAFIAWAASTSGEAMFVILFTPVYLLFQWGLFYTLIHRNHVVIPAVITGLIVPIVMIIMMTIIKGTSPKDPTFPFMAFLIGAIGFGLSFYLLRLYLLFHYTLIYRNHVVIPAVIGIIIPIFWVIIIGGTSPIVMIIMITIIEGTSPKDPTFPFMAFLIGTIGFGLSFYPLRRLSSLQAPGKGQRNKGKLSRQIPR